MRAGAGRETATLLTTTIDPIWLNLRAPMADAIGATVCGEWSKAADLWFDVTREAAYRSLASVCGAEAALSAGLLDMAEYFYLGVAEMESAPPFLALLRARNAPIRQARMKYYAHRRRALERLPSLEAGRELIRLHLYREAVRTLLLSAAFTAHPAEAAPLLARAYAAMGAHVSLVALHERAALTDPKLIASAERSERLLTRLADPPAKNIRRFLEQHPAGQAFAVDIEDWGRPPASQPADAI